MPRSGQRESGRDGREREGLCPVYALVSLPFVSIHRIIDGKLVLWCDYWDLQTLLGKAPQWWLEHIAKKAAEVGVR